MMENKKLKIFFTILGFTFLFGIPAVSADLIPPILGNTLTQLTSLLSQAIWRRVMLFIMVFSILYIIAQKIQIFQKEDKTIQKGPIIAVSIAIAVIAVVGIPDGTVNIIFQLYSGIFALILLLGPMAGLLYLTYKKDGDNEGAKSPMVHFVRFLLFGLLWAALSSSVFGFLNAIPIVANSHAFSTHDIIGLLRVVVMILFFVEFFRMFKVIGLGSTPSNESGGVLGGASDIWNKAGKNDRRHAEKKAAEDEQNLETKKHDLTAINNILRNLAITANKAFEKIKQGVKNIKEVMNSETFKEYTELVNNYTRTARFTNTDKFTKDGINNFKRIIEGIKSNIANILIPSAETVEKEINAVVNELKNHESKYVVNNKDIKFLEETIKKEESNTEHKKTVEDLLEKSKKIMNDFNENTEFLKVLAEGFKAVDSNLKELSTTADNLLDEGTKSLTKKAEYDAKFQKLVYDLDSMLNSDENAGLPKLFNKFNVLESNLMGDSKILVAEIEEVKQHISKEIETAEAQQKNDDYEEVKKEYTTTFEEYNNINKVNNNYIKKTEKLKILRDLINKIYSGFAEYAQKPDELGPKIELEERLNTDELEIVKNYVRGKYKDKDALFFLINLINDRINGSNITIPDKDSTTESTMLDLIEKSYKLAGSNRREAMQKLFFEFRTNSKRKSSMPSETKG